METVGLTKTPPACEREQIGISPCTAQNGRCKSQATEQPLFGQHIFIHNIPFISSGGAADPQRPRDQAGSARCRGCLLSDRTTGESENVSSSTYHQSH